MVNAFPFVAALEYLSQERDVIYWRNSGLKPKALAKCRNGSNTGNQPGSGCFAGESSEHSDSTMRHQIFEQKQTPKLKAGKQRTEKHGK
jgi:hypothetical protein